jgi:hypothetical protein
VAATESEAVQEVQRALTQWGGSIHWVAVPHPGPSLAGHAKDDPDFDLYLEEIRRYRQEVEARECSDSSFIPTV